MTSVAETLATADAPLTQNDPRRQIAEALAAARAAQPAWAARPVAERAKAIRRIRDYVADHREHIAEVIARDNGKTRVDAMAAEVVPSAMAASYYARNAARFLRPRGLGVGNILFVNKRSTLHRVPFGVVGIISPWNYPFSIPFSEVVMALLAGNGVLLKVASETPEVGRVLAECVAAAELPDGLFQHLTLPGRIAGPGFLEAGVDKLFFTGSVPVGKSLMAKAAETLTPVSLELGGNDAMVVCADADLDRAAAGAVWAGFQNCGQSCGGVERIYVHASVFEPFTEKLAERLRALRIGPAPDHGTDLGRMTTARQAATVQRHIDAAVADGARVLVEVAPSDRARASDDAAQWLPATVLVDVSHDMEVMREESFGPVVGVMPFADDDEAVALANDSDLGLTGSVWSRDRGRARAIARRIQAGAVVINDHLMTHGMAETPWGGFKQSGIGRTHGEPGFDEMTEPQVIVDDLLPGVKRDLWWHPHGPDVYAGLTGALDALYGRAVGRRLAGLGRLLRLMPRMFRSR